MPPLLRAWPISDSYGCGFWIDQPIAKPPAPLWRDRLEAQFASHPACHLAARPQTAIRRRLVKAHAQSRQKIGFQDRCRCAVAAAQIAESLGSFGIRQAIVRSIVRQTPSPPILARWCDHAPVARSSGSAASPWHPEIQTYRSSSSATLKCPHRRNASQSPDSALKPICFASPCESAFSTSSQSAGNRMIHSLFDASASCRNRYAAGVLGERLARSRAQEYYCGGFG
jgi:hypothetical protein